MFHSKFNRTFILTGEKKHDFKNFQINLCPNEQKASVMKPFLFTVCGRHFTLKAKQCFMFRHWTAIYIYSLEGLTFLFQMMAAWITILFFKTLYMESNGNIKWKMTLKDDHMKNSPALCTSISIYKWESNYFKMLRKIVIQ